MEKVFDSILSYEGGPGERRYLVSPRTVSDFFTNGNYFLRIPDYQRPYSWTEKNITDLLDDIHKLSLKSDSSWFLGPIFTVRKSNENRFSELLDGQQRITTIQIILREASLIKLQLDGVDFKSMPDINKKLKTIIDTCQRCLVKLDDLKPFPVFETEPSMREVFNSYIVNFEDIEDYQELKEKRKQFEYATLKIKVEGSITAGTILEAISVVRGFIKSNFLTNDRTIQENLEGFINFVNALVSKCWLIEIPLHSHEDSIQIFESLNNRGKKLTLVDKLRFKSILKSSKDSIDLIRLKWKQVYSGINFMIEENYVKNEDDFYKVFFNSIKGDGYTKEEDFIKLFVEEYLNSDDSIKEFLEETLHIVEFYKIISTALNDKNSFVEYFDRKDQNKVKALLQLLKQALVISDNSRFILFYLVRTYSHFKDHKFIIVQCIWNLIRYVLHEEIYANKKSNVIRTEYLDRLKDYYIGKTNIEKSLDIASFVFTKSLSSLIRTRNSNEAKFILYFYAYLTDYDILSSHSPNQYSYSQLDHMCPQKWVKNWSTFAYVKADVLKYITILENDPTTPFSKINWQQFRLDIELSEIDLQTGRSGQYEESLIEYIGNKWVLHAGTNIKASNNNFALKKNEYHDQKWIKIPSNSDIVGVDSYMDFSYEDVVNRTLRISDTIISKFQNAWDNV